MFSIVALRHWHFAKAV